MTPPGDAADHDPLALTELAVELARRAGAVVTEMAEDARRTASTKSSPTDVVTEADRAAEVLITDGILAARPDDSILGEEGAAQTGPSPILWHIDPIDGTTNYVYGIPAYSISIAAEHAGQTVAGVVFNPRSDELFRATRGLGATCNDEPLTVRNQPDLGRALVATGFGYRPERRRHQGRVVAGLIEQVRDLRRFGSAALDLCAVAAGRVDAYYELGLNRWDIAAGELIATEAGAVVGDLDGGSPDTGFLLAAGPSLFGPLGDALRALEAAREGPTPA